MQKLIQWLGLCALGGILLCLSFWNRQARFEDKIPQLMQVLDCDCNTQLTQEFESALVLRTEIVDKLAREVLQQKLPPEQALICADQLLAILEDLTENTEILKTIQQTLILKFYAFSVKGETSQLPLITQKALEVANRSGYLEGQVIAYYHRIGTLKYEDAEHLEEEYILSAERLAKQSMDKYLMLLINEMYRSYAKEKGDVQKEIALALEARELATEEKNKQFAFNAELNLGVSFLDQKSYNLAESSLLKANQLAHELDFPKPIEQALQYLIILYATTGEVAKAESYHQELVQLLRDFPKSANRHTRLAQAYYLYANQQYEAAESLLASPNASLQDRYNEAELRFLMAQAQAPAGSTDALQAYEAFRDIKDSLNIISYGKTAELNLSLEREQFAQTALQTEQKHNALKTKALWFLVGVLGVIAMQFFFLLKSWRKSKEQNLLLAESNQRLKNFSKIVSHDLRDPLRTIHSYSELIERRVKEPDVKLSRMIKTVLTASATMDQLLRDVRRYSESFTPKLEQERVDLRELLQTIKENLSDRITSSEAELQATDLPIVHANESALYQIFQNLILNAIHYTPSDRKPIIRISAEQKKYRLQIVIADNGKGIAEEELEKVFEPYYRGNIKQPGTGLGLAIVKNCVAMLDGQIWVESQLGEGSRFIIQLPASVLETAS
ncbi:MAG: ATP-binding protein [Bacteroidota bacterium]